MSSSTITKEEVDLPRDFRAKLAFVLHNVCSTEECDEYIRKTEEMGYDAALLNTGVGQVLRQDIRNSSRCIWDSAEEADKIFRRIQQFLPEVWLQRKLVGLNERLRFLRYNTGEYFKPHMDGIYERDDGERSYITVQLYLNEGFEGGSTTFMNHSSDGKVPVVPKTGSVLVFQHDIMHEGSILKKGVKYAMRTDVMYSADKIGKKTR